MSLNRRRWLLCSWTHWCGPPCAEYHTKINKWSGHPFKFITLWETNSLAFANWSTFISFMQTSVWLNCDRWNHKALLKGSDVIQETYFKVQGSIYPSVKITEIMPIYAGCRTRSHFPPAPCHNTPKFRLAKSSLNIIFNSCSNSAFPLWNIFHALTVWNTVNVQDCSRTIVSQNLRAFYKPSLLARLCLLWLLVCLDHPETNTRDTR